MSHDSGWRTWGRSYVPEDGGDMIGMLIPHGESVTIGHKLTLKDDSGAVVHRPTVYFVYCPSDAAVMSAKEVEARGFKMDGLTNRIMCDDITSGKDKLGVLLLGHDYKAWWTGSLLSIDQARELVPGQNATSMQVLVWFVIVCFMCMCILHPVNNVLDEGYGFTHSMAK